MKNGWSRQGAGRQAAATPSALPPIAVNGTNNGACVHSRHLWWQNEDTDRLPGPRRSPLVQRAAARRRAAGPKSPEPSLQAACRAARLQGRAGRRRAAGAGPDRLRLGADGKLWVVEMGDYPLGIDGKGKPGGRVKFLEDTDGDGRYDKATVFLDGLGFPTGVMPWRKGVLVTCAPDIFYAEDTDGDGKADKREVLFTGFSEGNQQHRVNGLVWGLDNWVYGANGDSGGVIKSLEDRRRSSTSAAATSASGPTPARSSRRAARRSSAAAATTGATGSAATTATRCGTSSSTTTTCAATRTSPPPDAARAGLGRRPAPPPVFPISRTLPRFNDPHAANHFTSACSPIVYRDDLFGPAFASNAFVSEPVHNLVHREVLRAEGRDLHQPAGRRRADREFLASTRQLVPADDDRRPARTGRCGSPTCTARDRAPEWIPTDWQKKLDLRAGHDKGRIYRVYPVGTKPRPIPRLDKLDTAGLVAALDSPSGWQRDMAQMTARLAERQGDASARWRSWPAESQEPAGPAARPAPSTG